MVELAASDADAGDSVTFAITGGVDADLFEIDSDTQITVSRPTASPTTRRPPPTAADQTGVVTVTASDGANPANTAAQTITVTITDVNDEDPAFTSSATPTIAENVQNVVVLAATDADAGDSVTFAITGGADADLFEIDSDTQLRFKANSVPDYESSTADGGDQDYVVIVTAS